MAFVGARRWESGLPRAGKGGFPYPDHRTLDNLMSVRCPYCRGKSPDWKVGQCDPCGSTGKIIS